MHNRRKSREQIGNCQELKSEKQYMENKGPEQRKFLWNETIRKPICILTVMVVPEFQVDRRGPCCPKFTAVLPTITEVRKQLKCPSRD